MAEKSMPPAQNEKVDLALQAKWIVPIIPRDKVFEDCAILICDGAIDDIVPADSLGDYAIDHHINLGEQVLMPGLINAHGHSAMSLLRGYADDKPLMDWLENHIWPAEMKWVSHEFVADGTELAIAEMLRAGTTCFSDMYFFPEAAAKKAFDTGIRAQICFPIMDFPCAWGSGPENYIAKGLALHDNYRSSERINIGFGPHAPYTVSDEPLSKIVTLAEELQAPIQIHLHETVFEVEQSIKEKGVRPLQRMADLGLISPLSQLVHMTQINNDDIQTLITYSPSIVHCPHSNLKLASGFCPVDQLTQNDINVCLGTDGAASNNGLSLFDEMRTAAMLGKTVANNAAAVNAFDALEMATINGAKAMGTSHQIGSIEKGKRADIIAIDMSHVPQRPVHNIISQLVYTNVSERVSNVWVDGKQLLKDNQLTTIDTKKLMGVAHNWQTKLSS